jgi:hypothetical protein
MHGGLRAYLDSCARIDIARVPRFSPPEATARFVKALGAENLEVDFEVPEDRRKVIREKVFSNRFHELTKREWRYLPYCLWGEEPYIADVEGIFSRLGRHCRGKRREIKNLIGAYFHYYSDVGSGLRELSGVILKLIKEQEWAKEWQEKHESFSLFDPREAHVNFAENYMRSDISFSDFMPDVFRDWHKKNLTSFFGEVFREVCEKAADSSPGDEVLVVEIMEWAVNEEGDLRYSSCRGALASALLRPFEVYALESEFKDEIINFMLKHYGDPRLDRARWATVEPRDKDVMLRWLSRRSLEVFFSVVDKVAKERHWKYRKKFWEHYLEYDMEVWVVFGRDCEVVARSFGKDLNYATFEGGSPQRNHAVLIMSLKNLIITDWSHDGACRIYSSPVQRPPELYKATYHAEDLRNIKQGEEGHFSHRATENNPYAWQPLFGRYIYEKTSIRIRESDYRIEK